MAYGSGSAYVEAESVEDAIVLIREAAEHWKLDEPIRIQGVVEVQRGSVIRAQ